MAGAFARRTSSSIRCGGSHFTLFSNYRAEAALLTYGHLAFTGTSAKVEKGVLAGFREEREVAVEVEGTLRMPKRIPSSRAATAAWPPSKLRDFLNGLLKEMRSNRLLDADRSLRGESILKAFFERLQPEADLPEDRDAALTFAWESVTGDYEIKSEEIALSLFA